MHTRNYQKNPEKTADILRCQHWFQREMKSEERVQKFHTDEVSLPRLRLLIGRTALEICFNQSETLISW